MPIKFSGIDFSDFSGGKNSAFPRHAIADNQACDTLNALHEAIGASRAPGYIGAKTTPMFAGVSQGMFVYNKADGTQVLIVVSGGKIYSVSGSTATEIGSISGAGECYAVNLSGKLWIVNGTSFVKVENDLSVYRVQIVAPIGATAVVGAGGSLAAGVYSCYVAYARKDSSGRYFYSLPQLVGNKTVSPGNQTITFTIANSSDPQVTHKVVFMSDADGTVQVYYGEVTNATATIAISSTANRIDSVYMSTVSAPNQILPISPNGIYAFDDKLFVWDDDGQTIYWSLNTDINSFDLERFLPENFRTLSKTINAVFSIPSSSTTGEDLFFNHLGNGISVAPNGDMSGIIKFTQRQYWFLNCKTPEGKSNVVFPKSMAFGLTNDGFRFFDGTTFSEDVSFHIKPDVDKIITSFGRALPSAVIYRRPGKRTEYRFSYNNIDYSSAGCNDQRIFNLDFYFTTQTQMTPQGMVSGNRKLTWECWENGFEGQVILNDAWVGLQSIADGSQIVSEGGASDIFCYTRLRAFTAVAFVKQLYILSKTHIDALNAITVWGPVYSLATSGGNIIGNIILFDANNAHFPFTIKGASAQNAVLPADGSGGLPIPFVMAPQYPINTANSIAFAAKGNSVAIEISQTENDTEFFLYKIQLPMTSQVIHNLT